MTKPVSPCLFRSHEDARQSLTKPWSTSLLQDDCGDYVVVKNARKVTVTGKKADQKLYRHHTQFPGGLKEIPYKTMLDRNPEEVSRPLRSLLSPCVSPACSGFVSGCTRTNRLI